MELPTREHSVKGLMFAICLASLGGMHTRSSLHIGMISTEYVYLKLAVFECVSEDKSCSEDFDLRSRQPGIEPTCGKLLTVLAQRSQGIRPSSRVRQTRQAGLEVLTGRCLSW